METISLHPSQDPSAKTGIPFYLYATVISSLSIIIGLIWDISWHMSIGRDGLFSPPHLAIYLGGVTAGIFSGYNVLKITIAGTPDEKGRSVKFWGIFYGSLGNLFCIWGAIAMLTSAPFDDWWHNTYGLDVTILSPPHTVLLLGMITIQFGAIISVLSYQNISSDVQQNSHISSKGFNVLFSLSAGFIICMIFTMASEYLGRHDMHQAFFYSVSCLLFPLFLTAFSVSSKSRWGATNATLVYTVFLMLMNWILPLFPAEPKLGPVYHQVTHFVPPEFPILLIVPAIAIDLIRRRSEGSNAWKLAAILGAAFVAALAIAQWPFADFLMSPLARNWFLGTRYFGYCKQHTTPYFRNLFHRTESGGVLWQGSALTLVTAIVTTRLGIAAGTWMRGIRR